MSVAFRRESDEEHLEPKFERPLPSGPNLVTPRGMALIVEQVAELEALLLQSEDEAARAAFQRDLRYWKARRVSAEVAPIPAGNKVEFGTQVSILLHGKPKTFRIVGDDESDPSAGLISFNAPLSRAMLGLEAGEVVSFGAAVDGIEIVKIEVMVQHPISSDPS